jgi:hypothetical protein
MKWAEIGTSAATTTLLNIVVIPFMFYFLKRIDERKTKQFEVRYTEYKRYLAVLEETSTASRAILEDKFLPVVWQTISEIVDDSSKSEEALRRLFTSMNEFTKSISGSLSRVRGEIHGLRFELYPKNWTGV